MLLILYSSKMTVPDNLCQIWRNKSTGSSCNIFQILVINIIRKVPQMFFENEKPIIIRWHIQPNINIKSSPSPYRFIKSIHLAGSCNNYNIILLVFIFFLIGKRRLVKLINLRNQIIHYILILLIAKVVYIIYN